MKSKIIISEQEKQLIPAAFNMLKYSYSPYSNLKVGAALLSSTGKIFGGCNIDFFWGGNCLCSSDCNFQSGEWRWKIVFSNLHRWRQKWWCSGFLFSVRNFADRFFLNSVNLILKLFSLPHWLTSKFLLYPTFCLKVFHCDEFLKCYSKGILRIFIQRGYNSVCVAVFSWWMKEDCKIRIYCTLNFLE